MIVFVSLFGALPHACEVDDERGSRTVGELCESLFGDTLWEASKFVIGRAEKAGLEWESDLSVGVGASFRGMRAGSVDTALKSVPRGHVIFVHFETVPPNVTRDELVMLAHRRVQLPDACDMLASHAAVVRRCRASVPCPHFVRIWCRSGSLDMVVSAGMSFEDFFARACERMKQRQSSVYLFTSGGDVVISMDDVRSVSHIRARTWPPVPGSLVRGAVSYGRA